MFDTHLLKINKLDAEEAFFFFFFAATDKNSQASLVKTCILISLLLCAIKTKFKNVMA